MTSFSRLGQDSGKTWALPESDTQRHTRPPLYRVAGVSVSRETRTQARLGRACKAPPADEAFETTRRDSGLPVRRNEVASRRLARVRPDRRSLGRPRMKPPRQAELDLGPEAPPREMVVAGPDLARTIGELRAAGYEVAAMDTKGATYRLHVRRVAPPPLPRKLLPPPPGRGTRRTLVSPCLIF